MDRLPEAAKWVNSIPCDERAAGTYEGTLGGTSGWIDTSGYDQVTMVVSFGAIAAGVTPIDVELYEADTTGGAGAAIASAKIVSAAGGDEDDQIALVNVRTGGRAAGTRKKYVRPHLVAGGTGNFDCNVHIVLSQAKNVPVVNSPVAVLV